MTYLLAFLTGLVIGSGVMLVGIYIQANQITGSLDACRAANPGYECVVGWVRGEAFE